MGDDARKRRRDLRVPPERLCLSLTGFRDLQPLLGRGYRRLGGGHLRFGDSIARHGFVDVLLRHKIGPRLEDAGEARRTDVCHLMRRIRALEIGLRAVHVLLGSLDAGCVLAQLILQLRDFEHRDPLAGLYAIADVHADRLQITRDLCVDVDFLKRPKFRGNGQRLGQVAGHRLDHGDRWRVAGLDGRL